MKTLLTGSGIFLRLIGLLLAGTIALLVFIFFTQRRLIFFPSHAVSSGNLKAWTDGGRVIGFCSEADQPRAIWLMTHGNGGQASQREYVLPRMAPGQSLYVLEYPGYGLRPGRPTQSSMNAAAEEAYHLLRQRFPHLPVCVLGESIGSGPASFLATLPTPPDKIILVVPFDTLASVASEQMPFLPVKLILRDKWDNLGALKSYRRQVVIYGAKQDRVIPIHHAETLSKVLPQARFIPIEGGHNDWSFSTDVLIDYPS